jgi:predicted nucleic acid-binding protein
VAFYVDTSAVVKFVVHEPHADALRDWAVGRELVGSDLVRTETLRAARRHSPAALAQARLVLAALPTLTLTPSVCERAAELDPAVLRTLDALHLACALELGGELDGVVTYDDRMAAACSVLGVAVVAPSTAA